MFENLPTDPQTGHMYNISSDFTTDNRFVEGAGIFYHAGANIYWTKDGKWDVMVGTQITGVKGESESTYRVGNVNITKTNIGLGNVNNTADANKHVASAKTITETLPITKGGTGKTTGAEAIKSWLMPRLPEQIRPWTMIGIYANGLMEVLTEIRHL